MCQTELKNFATFWIYLQKTIFLNCNFLENVNRDFRKKLTNGRKKCVLSTVKI